MQKCFVWFTYEFLLDNSVIQLLREKWATDMYVLKIIMNATQIVIERFVAHSFANYVYQTSTNCHCLHMFILGNACWQKPHTLHNHFTVKLTSLVHNYVSYYLLPKISLKHCKYVVQHAIGSNMCDVKNCLYS